MQMQKLKVYLQKHNYIHNHDKNKNNNHVHKNSSKNDDHGVSQSYLNTNIGQNNDGRNNRQNNNMIRSSEHGNNGSKIIINKRTTSNFNNNNNSTSHAANSSNTHNKSLQNIYNFRQEVRNLLNSHHFNSNNNRYQQYKKSNNYHRQRQRQIHNRSHQDRLQKGTAGGMHMHHQIIYNNISKKNTKHVYSESRLGYRSQPHNNNINYSKDQNKYEQQKQKEKQKAKNNKSQKNFGPYLNGIKIKNQKQIKQVKAVVGIKTRPKQIPSILTNKNNQSKLPAKKRSKSANPNEANKKNQLSKICQRQKQKRSSSLKKVSKLNNSQTPANGYLPVDSLLKIKNTQSLPPQSISGLFLTSMFRTRKGVQIMNPNKVNQDRFYVKENILYQCKKYKQKQENQQEEREKYISMYAIADGHGPNGHYVSHLIVQNLYKRLDYYLKNKQKRYSSYNSIKNADKKSENIIIDGSTQNIQRALDRSFHDIQNLLLKTTDFNSEFSGSTLVTLVIQNNKHVICANVGDSRAIVARQLNKTSWQVVRLSNDHKPNVEQQKQRILNLGGRIQTVYDQEGNSIGPLRVWLPKKQIQGLAMSRSLGDNISKPIGVTHIPQILSHELTKDDKFILLASDGVWQFLTNYQILNLIIPYYRQNRLQDACQALMKQAYRSWTKQDNTVIDDITFILIFITVDGNMQEKQCKKQDKQQQKQRNEKQQNLQNKDIQKQKDDQKQKKISKITQQH